METTTQYPDWQKAIRAAQAAEEEWIARQVEADEAEQRRKDAEQAANLKFVLALAGIEAEPVKNNWVMDGYVFWLGIEDSYQYNTTSYRIKGKDISFTLYINKHLPDGSFANEFSWKQTVKQTSIDSDWMGLKANIAYALDELDGNYEAALRRQMIAQTMPMGRREMTLEERLADVLRDFILREIRPAAEGD